jgi:hypothetical protein
MHGMPVAPFRAKGHRGSGFIAYRLGVLSARDDSVASAGWLWPAYDAAATPLSVAVASAECCTSGLFYRGFPRVVWLQVCPVAAPHPLSARRCRAPSMSRIFGLPHLRRPRDTPPCHDQPPVLLSPSACRSREGPPWPRKVPCLAASHADRAAPQYDV